MSYMAHKKETKKETRKEGREGGRKGGRERTTPRVTSVVILGTEEDSMSASKLLDSGTRSVPDRNIYFSLFLEEAGCPARGGEKLTHLRPLPLVHPDLPASTGGSSRPLLPAGTALGLLLAASSQSDEVAVSYNHRTTSDTQTPH